MKNNDFDWHDYFKLAESYKSEEDIAKTRTGIGRFYYSSFLESRDYILNHELFLNPYNEEIMRSTSCRIHHETRFTFKKHEKLNKNNIGARISQRLNVLRKYRNTVDYDSKNPKNLKHIYNRCCRKSKKIFELLQEIELI